MKKTLLLFVTLLLVNITNAQTVGDIFTVDNIEYEVTVVGTPNEVRVNTSTLAAVVVPVTVNNGGVDYNVTLIKPGAFRDFNTLTITSLVVQGDTEIGLQAFQGCTNLVSADLKNVTSRVGNSAFLNCTSLETVDLSGLTAAIGNNVFKNCSSLSSINIGNATQLGTQAFNGCAFTSINLPSVTLIGNLCFFNCEEMTSISMPVVEQINTGAFNNTGLTSVTFPSTLTTLIETNYNMFENSENLTTITSELDTPPVLTYQAGQEDPLASLLKRTTFTLTKIIVPDGSVAAYQAADVWKDFTIEAAPTLSINSSEASLDWSVYVNGNVLNVTNNESKNANITLFNIGGSALLNTNISGGDSQVDITSLSSGVYILKVNTDNGIFTKKFVKQ